ncbi:hypothetical protein EVAR_80462_1 [Eumeta japonica]|uniref:Uncharacterized protein n=1 Tax=Eumeta variegata TaxID=151549 RepID=A0A4C1VGW6_EUMVA|nr:hypothetical protein EVAR_80462_1 [Eumeta japonica]
MAGLSTFVFVLCMMYYALGKPVEFEEENVLTNHSPRPQSEPHPSHKFKRFINQALTSGGFADRGLAKMRTKRGIGEDCEKLELCMLHARSQHSLFASFELYFVNKENARLWDHHAHSVADCESRYSDCV